MRRTTVSLQLDATDFAGDWATRDAGDTRTATASCFPGSVRSSDAGSQLAVRLFDLRGAVEACRRGGFSVDIAVTRTQFAELVFGTPGAYRGLRFGVGA